MISSIGLKSSIIYSNQELKARRNHTYIRFSFEPSGNLISAYNKLAGKEKINFVNDNNDSIYAYRVKTLNIYVKIRKLINTNTSIGLKTRNTYAYISPLNMYHS